MYSPSNFGLSADILKVVSSVMEEGRRITKENLAEQVVSGVWNIEGQSGSVVSVYDTSSRTRFKLEVLDELKMKNSDAALKLKKEISSLETSISKLTPLARKDDSANMKLVASKKRLEAKKAEHSKLMKEESYKTSAGATEAKVVQAVGQIKHFAKEMYKGDIKKAYNDWAGKTTFGPVLKAEVLKRAGGVNEATDPVDKKELTKSFEKRKDKDIDNDGDTDSSDEYLHKRRKAISKAMKEEVLDEAQKLFMFKTKQEADKKAKEIKGKVIELGPKNFAVVTKDLTVIEEQELDELSKKTLGSYVKGASHDISTKSAATGRYAERAKKASDDMKASGDYSKYTQKRKDDETADKMFNKSWKRRIGVAKAVDKLTKEEQELDELSKKTLGSYVKGASHDISTKSAATGRYAERAKKASDDMKKTRDYSQYTQKRKDDETADKMFNKSWKRRIGVAKAVDKLTKEEVELDEAKMEAAVEKTQADINHAQKYMKAADNQGDVIKHMNRLSMLRKQLSYQKAKLKEAKETDAEMEDEDGDGEKDKKKKKGKFEKYDIVNTKPSDDKNKTMMQTDEETILEIAGKKLTSFEKEKFYELKKKHENNKTHRLLRKQYGDKGDDIFHGKLIKMVKGSYDGTHSKNEEFEFTAEDFNNFDELAVIGRGEDLDELSKKTLGTYVKKASHDVATKAAATGRYAERANKASDDMKTSGDYSKYTQKRKDDETADKMFKKSWKRRLGINKAVDKMTKEELELDEISKDLAKHYINTADMDMEFRDDDITRTARSGQSTRDLRRKNSKRLTKTYLAKAKLGQHDSRKARVPTTEELELDEQDQPVKRGRGRPRKDAAASSETSDSGDRHIVNQMRKAVSLNGHHVVFDNGEKKHVDRVTAQVFINKYNNLDKPMHKEIISKSAIKSHEHFKNALKGKVEAPKSNKIDMPKLKSDVMTGKY